MERFLEETLDKLSSFNDASRKRLAGNYASTLYNYFSQRKSKQDACELVAAIACIIAANDGNPQNIEREYFNDIFCSTPISYDCFYDTCEKYQRQNWRDYVENSILSISDEKVYTAAVMLMIIFAGADDYIHNREETLIDYYISEYRRKFN